jgi:hypothetical protein
MFRSGDTSVATLATKMPTMSADIHALAVD